MHTQHINNNNPYMVASVTRILFRPYLVKSVFTHHCIKAPVSNKRTACNHHFHQKCHPQCVWSREVTIQSCQVASPNNRTICVYLFTFIICQVTSPKQWTVRALPCFERSVLNNGQLEFIFRRFQAASPNGPFEVIFYLFSSRQS